MGAGKEGTLIEEVNGKNKSSALTRQSDKDGLPTKHGSKKAGRFPITNGAETQNSV
jgi:hypothetical protein